MRLLSFAHASIASSGWHSKGGAPGTSGCTGSSRNRRVSSRLDWSRSMHGRTFFTIHDEVNELTHGGTGASVAPRCSASAAENSLQLCESGW